MKGLLVTNKITKKESESFNIYLKEIASIKLFTPDEEYECCKKVKDGDEEAKDELIKRNLRFVISVAKQYENPAIPIEDLINEGNLGLIMGVNHYDPTKGMKLISYAVFWIRKSIMEYISNYNKMVRLPCNKLNDLSKYNNSLRSLEQKLGRNVDINDVIDEMYLELGDELYDENGDSFDEEIRFTERLSIMCVDSLNKKVSSDGESTQLLEDILEDDSFKSSDHLVIPNEYSEQIVRGLKYLKPKFRVIMMSLYGLCGKEELTFNQVAEKMNLEPERIKLIKTRCLKKLAKRITL
jgi:RNA polymerase primary sigma factor